MMPNSVYVLTAADLKARRLLPVVWRLFPNASRGEAKKILSALLDALVDINGPSRLPNGDTRALTMTAAGKAKVINRATARLGYTEGNPEARHGQT